MYRKDVEALVRNAGDKEQNVRFSEYIGRWSAFEGLELDGATYYIYESNRYGDETCYLVVKYIDNMPIDIYETYDGLIQCLIDEDIISVVD